MSVNLPSDCGCGRGDFPLCLSTYPLNEDVEEEVFCCVLLSTYPLTADVEEEVFRCVLLSTYPLTADVEDEVFRCVLLPDVDHGQRPSLRLLLRVHQSPHHLPHAGAAVDRDAVVDADVG